ncbi:hypothetical protein AGMMS49546_28790 [Spirochaetia bacterium]|nr:hypothetical protein AGMMS49546_28790 [Spirochaetia bacterium]
MIITKNLVLEDYKKLKKLSLFYFSLKLYSWTLDIISTAACVMYNFNIFYYDWDFETLLGEISKKIKMNKSNSMFSRMKNRVVFYDYFSNDNIVLTQQYLQGLMDNNYEILYVTLQEKSDKMAFIMEKLNKYGADIYFAKGKNKYTLCKEIIEKILEYGASKILYQTVPWDSVGPVVLSFFDNSGIDRFLINLNDHAFWLGCKCADYILEFRSYGVNISIDNRNIDIDKLIVLPYYPTKRKEISFNGFPFDSDKKKIIVSGGALYKIYGSDIFFSIVKYILDKYQDTIFYYLGDGDTKPLQQFINSNNYSQRIFYERPRNDINEIIKRCYFYLGTYPICGGLMTQIAVVNGKIPVAFTEKQYPMNIIDELLINNEWQGFTFYSLEDLFKEIDELMTNENYYNNRTNDLKNKIISVYEFSEVLYSAIENRKTNFNYKRYNIDIENFSELYFKQENNYLHNYLNFFFFTRNPLLPIIYPQYFVKKLVYRCFP